jgi:hypothetical protein
MTWGISGGSGDDDSTTETGGPDADAAPAGGTYDPVTNQWQPVAAGPLSSRNLESAVWTGQEMLIWGGVDASGDTTLADGAAFQPE